MLYRSGEENFKMEELTFKLKKAKDVSYRQKTTIWWIDQMVEDNQRFS